MKARFFLIAFAALLAVPATAQNIPAGPDVWDTLGAGSTTVTLSGADWANLCGASSGDFTVSLKGFNLAGYGTGDTVINRLDDADLTSSSTATVDIQLAALSMVSDGSHPCSPATLRVTSTNAQRITQMTITRTSSEGGTFSASVAVDVAVKAVDSAGNPVGLTIFLKGNLNDTAASPWSYAPAINAVAATDPWHPGVDPITKKKVKVCRRGNKILPAWHCYQPRPKCKVVIQPAPLDATKAEITPIEIEPIAIEPCFIEAQPVN